MVFKYSLEQFVRTGEKMMVHKSIINYEGQLPEHGHSDFMEIFYITKGEGYHILNETKSKVEKGDLVFLSFVSRHTFEAITADFEWIDIGFMPEVISQTMVNQYNASDILRLSIFREFFNQNISNAEDMILRQVSDEFEHIMIDMLKEYTGCKRGYEQNLRYYLLILLTKIFRTTLIFNDITNVHSITGDKLICLVLDELNNEKFGEIDLEYIAKKACMGYKYFSRIFKQRVGISFTEFIHRKRVEKACELLSDTDFFTNEIMSLVGFKDSKSFYYNFKKLTGYTPNQYRKMKK